MTTESVVQATAPVENVPVVPETAADAQSQKTEAVADSTPASEAAETPAKKPDGFSKRIDELTRDFYAERRMREAADREAQELRQRVEALTPKPVDVPKVAPKLEDFQFDEERYRSAVLEYVKTEAARTAREALAEERNRQEGQSRAETFAKRQNEYLAKSPDYKAKVMENPRLPISEAMSGIIMESEVGPQVAEYLADNIELAAQIYKLDAVRAARELGRIEAKFYKPSVGAIAPKVSAAPPPPAKIEAKESAVSKDPHDMNFDEFNRWRGRYTKRK